MKKENAINFLLYTYFGVTLDDDDNDKIKAAIICAYNDATMQGAYNARFNKKNIPKAELAKLRGKSAEALKNTATLIFDEIKEFFSSKRETKYNE